MKADLISIVEAAYLPEENLDRWLQNLVRTADAAMSGGRGVFGIIVERPLKKEGHADRGSGRTKDDCHDESTNRSTILATGYSGLPDRILERAAPLLGFTPSDELLRRYVRAGPVGTLTGVFSDQGGDFSRRLQATGFEDAIYLRAANLKSEEELVLAIPGDAPIRLSGARRLLLSHVASHIKSAYRLRGRHADLLGEQTDIEAILSPDGKVEHASGKATQSDSRVVLRAAALACMKTKIRNHPVRRELALREWKALFSGRWSVVDHFDTDGKMFIVARRNDPKSPQAKGLTARENMVVALAAQGYSNKEIRYELGLPLSTIASSLTSAILKLGMSSRMALVRVLSSGRRA